MKRRIIFHIGLEKTGTDSFQRFCTEQRDLLLRHSTLYPTASLAFGRYNHEPLVACYLDYRDASIATSGRPRNAVLASLRAEIEAAAATTVLISGEHFSSRFRDAEIAALAADFADCDCHVAVVVREHAARLFSAYSQSVLAGRDMTLDAYCDEVFDPANPYMRCAETIGAWERVFGRDAISIFRHVRGVDMVPVLTNALIAPDLPAVDRSAYWDNLSIGPRATEWLRRVNAAVACIPGGSGPSVRRALRRPRRGVARLLAVLSDRDKGCWQLSPYNAARLAAIAETDDKWLATRYGAALSGRTASAVKASR